MLDDQLASYSLISAAGGWSALMDVSALGLDSVEASRLLLKRGRVAATPMRDWGKQHSDQYIRFVFSNEPCERLTDLGARVKHALG
jgi:aspartate/methionine/tyrosine aminotransferase